MRARSAQPAVSASDSFEAELARQRDDETAYRIKVAKPGNAAIAADDYDNLGLLGKAFYLTKSIPSNPVAGAYSSLVGGSAGFIRGLSETADENSPIAWAEKKIFGGSVESLIASGAGSVQNWADEKADAWRVMSGNRFADAALSGVESAPDAQRRRTGGWSHGVADGSRVAGDIMLTTVSADGILCELLQQNDDRVGQPVAVQL